MRILITGGAGFIGSNLAIHHVMKGDEVIVIDDLSTGKLQNIVPFLNHPKFSFHHQDLTTWTGLRPLLGTVNRVYHLAAMVGLFNVLNNPIKTLKVNINITLKLYECLIAQPNKPLLLLASTSEVYGNQPGELSEESPLIIANSLKNQAAYAISKLYDESLSKAYHDLHQLPIIILRIFNTIGLNQSAQYGMVVPRFIQQAMHHKPITIYGDGTQKRSFCDIRDLVILIDLIAQTPQLIGQIINVGNDEVISVIKLAKLIKKLSASRSPLTYIPFSEAYSDESIYIKERKPNLSKLLHYTGYRYQWTIEKTLSELIAYEKKQIEQSS